MSPGSKTMGDLNFLIYILFSEFFLINMYYSNKKKMMTVKKYVTVLHFLNLLNHDDI